MRAVTREVAGPPVVQRDGWTISSPLHSPANTDSFWCSGSGDGAARWSSAMALAPFDGLHDLLCRVVEIVGRHDVQSGLADDLLALLDIGAFEPHYQRHAEAHFAHSGGDAFGNHVALHDTAEDVDQDTLHIGVGGDDL